MALVQFLRLNRESRDGTRIKSFDTDGLLSFFAIAVAAVIDALDRRINLGDQLARPFAGSEFHSALRLRRRAIGQIRFLNVFGLQFFECRSGVLKDLLFPIQEFLVEILLHHRIHECFALRRLVVFWYFYVFLARHGIPLVPIQSVLTGAEYRNPRATPQAAVVDSKNLPRQDFLLL